jgi:hypothetical protein
MENACFAWEASPETKNPSKKVKKEKEEDQETNREIKNGVTSVEKEDAEKKEVQTFIHILEELVVRTREVFVSLDEL